MNKFKLSQTGLALIKRFEGCKLVAYRDAVGVPTIGYGHTHDVKMGQTITQAQADAFLVADVEKFERGVNFLVDELRVEITQNQFDALVCFAFNVGLRALEKSTLAKKLYLMKQKEQASIYAVADEFPRWNKAGGKVLPGLTKRRGAERLLFLGVEA